MSEEKSEWVRWPIAHGQIQTLCLWTLKACAEAVEEFEFDKRDPFASPVLPLHFTEND